MEHKPWLWKKKSTEKIVVSTEKANRGNEEVVQILVTDKAELERDLKIVNDKLSSAISECNSKDALVKKNAETAQEAIAGWEKAETEVVSLKQELGEAVQQRVAAEERLTHLDAALKECMQQLRFVREEQEQRIHDAVAKSSREFEKHQIVLAEKLEEFRKKISRLGLENSHLSKALLEKQKLIEDLTEHRTQADADFNSVTARLESLEKDNASLRYEVRVLEKELEIRNEEREFNRRTADASHKQHLESVKKIAKLESECQRLRILVRKRLPGPAALAKMKNEVELLGKDPADTRRRRLNYSPLGSTVDIAEENSPDTPQEKLALLTERLYAVEEENKALKENLHKKTNELQFSRAIFARTASKLSQAETQLEESSRGQTIMSQELCLASVSDVGSDDKACSSESWASALISELEHFKNGKQRETPSCKTDINLMDDFAEMEKLAVVSVNAPSGSSDVSSNKSSATVAPSGTEGKEIIPVSDHQLGRSASNLQTESKGILLDGLPGWLQNVLKVIMEQHHVKKRNPDHILEDIRVAWGYVNNSIASKLIDAKESLSHPHASNGETGVDTSSPEKDKQFHSNLNKDVSKMIELIEGISLPSQDYNAQDTFLAKDGSSLPYKISEISTGYMVRVFQWKTSELSGILQQSARACYDLLSGRVSLENFIHKLTYAFDWILNHCFSLQDVPSMRYAVKKHFDSESESEGESGMTSHFTEAEKMCVTKEQPSLAPAAVFKVYNGLSQMEDLQSDEREENKKLKDGLMSMELAKKDLEERLYATINQSESANFELKESERRVASLQTELEDRIETHKLMNEDLATELKVARTELNEVHQKFSRLELELSSRNNRCEKLEAMCLELQLQLESVMKEVPKNDVDQVEKTLRTDLEITAASEKLAECQETILNLGKQLKALASPREAEATFPDKVISSPIDIKNMNKRSSLLDKMLQEDDALAEDFKYPTTIETVCTLTDQKSPALLYGNLKSPFDTDSVNEDKQTNVGAAAGSLAIAPIKKRGGGGFLKKLLWRRKKGNGKKMALPFPA